jgi:hypothetical protein
MPKRAAPATVLFRQVLEQAKCRRDRERDFTEAVAVGECRREPPDVLALVANDLHLAAHDDVEARAGCRWPPENRDPLGPASVS